MSLRHRLIAGFVALGALLVVADVLLYRTVVDSLVAAVDERLTSAGPRPGPGAGPGTGLSRRDGTPSARAPSTGPVAEAPGRGFAALPPELLDGVPGGDQLLFEIRQPDGELDTRVFPAGADDSSAPAIEPSTVISMAGPEGEPPRPFTVAPADGRGPAYRAVATKLRNEDGYLVRGISLAETDATARRVLLLQGGATGTVLLGFALVAWHTTRLGIRPITRMTETADAIAAGDLDRVIPPARRATEAAALADALNQMLGRLRESISEKQQASDQLRRFVADASHELRTPLTSIRGYAELLRTGQLEAGEESMDALRRLDGEAHRMSQLVDELLLLAALDQGRPLERATVDLAHTVADAAAELALLQPDRPLEVVLPGPDDLPATVEGDPGRLRQVVDNLLANVRSHTGADRPATIELRREGAKVILVVADRGPGLPPGEEGRVFERFHRSDPARSGPGSGLGLSIVQAIVAAHDGTATASNRDGGGTAVTVTLPAGPVATATAAPFGADRPDR